MVELAPLYGVKDRAGEKDEAGVWVRVRLLSISRGLAFNIKLNLSYFEHIVLCVLFGKGVASLKGETGVDIRMKK